MATNNTNDLNAKAGDKILPKWMAALRYARENGFTFGPDVKVQAIASGGIHISAVQRPKRISHPFKCGVPDGDFAVPVALGLVNGEVPWVSSELRMGEVDPLTGDTANVVQCAAPENGETTTFISIGANVMGGTGAIAELTENTTASQLVISHITERPKGYGTGGVLADDKGWAWYPIAVLNWQDGEIAELFQVVRHNLGHRLAPASEAGGKARSFFYAAG